MQNDLNNLLEKAKDLLKEETTRISYETWIKDLEIQSMENGNITLLISTTFKKESIESRYHDLLVNTFNYLTNKQCSVTILSKEEIEKNNNGNEDKNYYKPTNNNNPTLKPEYTFDNFVVGENNRFAHAAALSVAEAPATSYNPLFIYGGVGLGKTHLMHAIGNEILRYNKNANILYVTSETFINQLVNAIKDGKNEQFRNQYRNIDVLLIDDIQFISGKDRCQEEFFHTFNALHENGKQIIISSDKPPKDIPLLEDRLKSRFTWGLITDISKADYETRFAILKQKAQFYKIIIDDEILSNIADKIDTNIRDLEGAIKKLVATASVMNTPITLEMSERIINEIVTSNKNVISCPFIQETVAKFFNITVEDLIGSRKTNDIVVPRQIAMYLCQNITQISTKEIGKDFGNRDHSTVIHACNKIKSEIEENNDTKLLVNSVKNLILKNK